ncbi:uncharacterized protein ACRADG_010558 [Cochliomyia hominivorax]
MKLLTFTKVLKYLLFWNCLPSIAADLYSSRDIYFLYNEIYKFELIIFFNFHSTNNQPELNEMLEDSTPKIVINNLEANMTKLQGLFTRHCLAVVHMANDKQIEWFQKMDQLLFKRHLSYILIILKNKPIAPFERIFQECWRKGFINVLLWYQRRLYTYNPYPQVKTLELENFSSFRRREYLKNFQQFQWLMPFIQHAPRCFSYIDRWGNLIRTGYIYKIIELFVHYYNGSLNVYDFNMWSVNLTKEEGWEAIQGFHFLCNAFLIDDAFDTSDSMWILHRYLMVPTDQEIPRGLYIAKPFAELTYAAVVLFCVIMCLLIHLHNNLSKENLSRSPLLESLAIIIGLSYGNFRNSNKIFDIILVALKFVGALILVNFYSCNLSSLAVTNLFEPELKTLEDIDKTNLYFYEYTLDAKNYEKLDLPSIIYKRLMSGNNTYLFYNRKNLNMHLNIFSAFEDIMNYYFIQQRLLSKRKAKALEESLHSFTFFIIVRHRLPVLNLFNHYLMFIKESGLVNKMIKDSEFDGLISHDIQLFQNPVKNVRVVFEHMQYVFALWLFGMMVAGLCFILEFFVKKIKKIMKK